MKRMQCVMRTVLTGGMLLILGHTGMGQPAGGIADPTTYLGDIRQLLQVQWPKNRTINIVCHGHSVPAGYFATPVVDTFNAYPHLLHRAIKERYPYAVVNVIVTAIGGEESRSGAARFERDVLALRPDVLLIDYSLNDRRIGLTAARTAWAEMIEKARARGIKVILLTPTPDQRADWSNPEDPLVQHAAQVRQLAKEQGVGLVDSLAAFQAAVAGGTPLPQLMAQSNHPNRSGHDLVVGQLIPWFAVPVPNPATAEDAGGENTTPSQP